MNDPAASLTARIEAVLARFRRADEPELERFVSGVSAPDDDGIDDGDRDYSVPQRPDFIQKELDGWH